MSDEIVRKHGCALQHGKHSDRVYVMHFDPDVSSDDISLLLKEIDTLVESGNYSKVFAKVPHIHAHHFEAAGYEAEAEVPHYCMMMCRYIKDHRRVVENEKLMEDVCDVAHKKHGSFSESGGECGATLRKCGPNDADRIASIYKEVFQTYPFPIYDPKFILETMEDGGTIYYCAEIDGEIAALSSAELYKDMSTAEMTDFATLPKYRGGGLSKELLKMMEEEMREIEIRVAYTIARAVSYGMNSVFSSCGYHYCGRLVNNTQISGGLESMNVWYKLLL